MRRLVLLALLVAGCSSSPSGSVQPPPPPPAVAAVLVSHASATVVEGGTTPLVASVRDAGGAVLTGRATSWISSNPGIASVSATGVVTGVAVGGPVTITATSEGQSGSAQVTVSAIPVANVTVTPATRALVVGESATLTAATVAAGGAVLTGRAVAWSSANPAIATVSASGVVTAVAAGGPITITATSEGQSATAQVTVTPAPVATVTVAPTTRTLAIGETATLTATTLAAGGATLTGRTITWSSANPAIATVSASGVVTAVAAGGPIAITATSEGQSGAAQITVSPPAAGLWTESNELRQGSIDPAVGFAGMASAANGTAVSFSGTKVFERSSVGVWDPVGTVIPGSPAVIAVHADPTGGFWATGSNGVIMRKVGANWVTENTGTNAAAFNGIAIRADGSGFAVGNPGSTIYARSAAGVWSTMPSPTSLILTHVGTPTPSFALAVGVGMSNGSGVGLVWTGGNWTTVSFPVANFKPDRLLVVSPTEAYALGVAGTEPLSNQRYTILEWTGAAWQILLQRPIEVYPMTAGATRCPDGTVYFGYYYGTIYRKQGATVTTLVGNGEIASAGFNLACDHDNALLLFDNTDARVMRFNGSWTTLRWRPNSYFVSMGSATSAVIGLPGSVARWNGTSWTRTTIPRPNGTPVVIAPAVVATGSQAVVGGSPAGAYSGGSWQWQAPSPSRGDEALWAQSPTQVHAAGSLGVMDYWNGAVWSTMAIPGGGPSWTDVLDGAGNYAVAALSFSTKAIHWDGTSWSLFPEAPPSTWGAVRVFSPTDVLNLRSDAIQRWNGTSWTTMPGGGPGVGTVMIARSANDITVFGSGQIRHYNGTAWSTVGAYTGTIRAASYFGNQAIAVGADGLVLRATLP